ncbi:MAG: AAA family ATPase [Alphaproteobacteria bacterium]|nr:AAA family ATPase [Alphaproteobacteria bacterium]
MIRILHINNFRNCLDVRLSIPDNSNIAVLHGKNGSGKTNILEAVSLLFEASGLRRAKYEEMISRCPQESSDERSGNPQDGTKNFWNIIAETTSGTFSSGYIAGENTGRRIYKVNDKNVRNLGEFRKDNYILWMTYETDRLFMQSPAERRNFIDMFCNVRFCDHALAVKNYEKLTRERLKILKRYCESGITPDVAKWLDIIEAKIAELGLKVATARIAMVAELEEYQIRNAEFPEFHNVMSGKLENEVIPRREPLDVYKLELLNRRQKDAIVGATTLGANRSDWQVFSVQKQINAEHCSAGEQKMMLIGIFLAFIIRNIETDNRDLTVLLDDVIAHLDSKHREILFSYIKRFASDGNQKISIWLSGTSKDLFNTLSSTASFFEISNGTCRETSIPA